MKPRNRLPNAAWFRKFVGTGTVLRFQFKGQFFPLDVKVIQVHAESVDLSKRGGGTLNFELQDRELSKRFISVDVLS